MADKQPKVSDATKAADRNDATTTGHADRMPTEEEAAKAEQNQLDPDAAAHYKEMAERGAKQRGEGRVEG